MRSITLSSVWCKIVQAQDKRILTFAGSHSTVYRQAKSALRLAITRTGR